MDLAVYLGGRHPTRLIIRKMPESVRVRRQGLEPRTRGLRVRGCAVGPGRQRSDLGICTFMIPREPWRTATRTATRTTRSPDAGKRPGWRCPGADVAALTAGSRTAVVPGPCREKS